LHYFRAFVWRRFVFSPFYGADFSCAPVFRYNAFDVFTPCGCVPSAQPRNTAFFVTYAASRVQSQGEAFGGFLYFPDPSLVSHVLDITHADREHKL